ncbi:MAG: hypothetical protein VKL01_04430 [Limnothrix sp.]|uniref:hypothetical protein n=1 Tax=unclassified Limnothrix TaxID=2632864 RepID=UPI00081E59AE|nr:MULTISPECIES: hypothetical protein [unclassified Limnothrix]MEB3117595.1 hypothetical protein [Limnothrix sp.]OCQ89260.1 hypothetical protein BCR12_01090 [Limnothrix sp. P13C2]MBD2160522.1 hypothetical protein [Limnothrix sp. FACHB-1083]MBD2191223.1 hypothetical protein [Limnothrix sp. FACHB-1088]MBD2552185.1 hypothetical protein [Limnothrix sp. FACHB-708]
MNFNLDFGRVILDFYREDPDLNRRLQILRQCRIRRRWRTLEIHCPNRSVAEKLLGLYGALVEPITALNVARHLSVFANGIPFMTLPLGDGNGSGFPWQEAI